MKNWLLVSNMTWGSGEFPVTHSKVRQFHFNGLFLLKVFEVWAKKYTEELYFMTLNSDAKFE